MEPSKPASTPAGFTKSQRAAMRAVEEQATLELVDETVRRLNRLGDRLEAFLNTTSTSTPHGEST